MTDDRMALVELIEQGADSDLVREMLTSAAPRMMDLEIEAKTGALSGVRSPARLNHSDGYRERGWNTRAGRVKLAIHPSTAPRSTAKQNLNGQKKARRNCMTLSAARLPIKCDQD